MKYLIVFLLMSSSALANREDLLLETGQTSEPKEEVGGLYLNSGVGGFNIESGEESLSGTHLGIEVMNRVTENFAFGPGVSQGYTAEGGLATYFTSYEMNANYSVIGSIQRNGIQKVEGGRAIYSGSRNRDFSLRLNGGLKQYFLNLRSGALYFSGVMVGVTTTFGLSSGIDLITGGTYELLSSGYRTLIVQKIYIGLSLDLN